MHMNLEVRNEYGLQWNIAGPGHYTRCGRTVAELPAGAYCVNIDYCGNTHYLERPLRVDDLVDFPDSLPNRVLREIEQFWGTGERFRRLGFLHRRGYLFHGKQGCGKSSLIHQIVSRIVDEGHVAFFCTQPAQFVAALAQFRQVEPQRPLVCVFEDIDAIIKEFGDSDLLQWLDGNCQVDKAINLASTNYPERLDRRIVSRPRRFDRFLKIESPDEHVRDAYFARKLPELSTAERRDWVAASEGLPFAALAELVISVCCLGSDLNESARTLRDLDSHTPSSSEYSDDENGVLEHPIPAARA
jgi:ATPase family associated with various cellular activities (AAA)